MPPEQRLKTRKVLLADQLHLDLFQNDLFPDLRQTIWFRHARNLKKSETGVRCPAQSEHRPAQSGVSRPHEPAVVGRP
jgi:hypothetical protein